jgi:putative oxidoreductase
MTSSKALVILGRVLLSTIFLVSGLGKLAHWKDTEALIAGRGLPAASLLLVGAVVFELTGGLCVISGFKVRAGAVILLVVLTLATLFFHNFWTYPEAARQAQIVQFMKNLAIAGGLLTLFATSAERPESKEQLPRVI